MSYERRQCRLTDITLEQYLLGELSEPRMEKTARIVRADARTRARLEALEQSNREILERYPPEMMGRQIRARLAQTRARPEPRPAFRPGLVTAWVGAAAVILALLLVAVPGELTSPGSGTTEEALSEQIKGDGPGLRVYRRTADGSEILEDGARVAEGDLLQLGYQAAGRAYGAIISVDGRGAVTLVLPERGDRAVSLTNDGLVLLDFALELDDAPRWERFYFVAGDAPFDLAPVLRAAERLDIGSPVGRPERLELEEDLDQFIFSLDKGAVLR